MNEPPTCKCCEEEYDLHDGMEPSEYCDPCAQERVSELETLIERIAAWPCDETAQTSGCECAPCLCRAALRARKTP